MSFHRTKSCRKCGRINGAILLRLSVANLHEAGSWKIESNLHFLWRWNIMGKWRQDSSYSWHDIGLNCQRDVA